MYIDILILTSTVFVVKGLILCSTKSSSPFPVTEKGKPSGLLLQTPKQQKKQKKKQLNPN